MRGKSSRFFYTTFLLLGLVIGLIVIINPIKLYKRASGIPANLVVFTGASYLDKVNVWRNLAQGGEETNTRMLAAVLPQVKALGASYIRIDHVFDGYNVVSRDGGGNLQFNWTSLDATLNDILATGAKPYIALSYMPPAISKGDIIEVPNNWSDWELVVQRTIEHISGTLGISGVYYEVWNEPDLFGKFKVYGDKNYLTLYSHSAIGAARAGGVKAFKFGGPATTALYENWMRGLLKMVSANNMRLDFISWHRYSKNLDVYEEDYKKATAWLADYPGYEDIELHITETGPNSENDKVYDNYFGAIHLMATSVLLEGDIDRLFHFEIKDGPGPEKYWSRWGILTHEKWGAPEAKPRYNAFFFLNKIRGEKLNVAGEGSWVKAMAKVEAGVIRVLVVNYDVYGTHSENVPIKFDELTGTKYLYKRTDYGGVQTQIEIIPEAGSFSTTEFMKPNSAMILELIPV